MKKTFRLQGLCCANCAAKIENNIRKLKGVDEVSVSIMTARMSIEADSSMMDDILLQAEKIIKNVEPDIVMRRA